MMEDDAIDGPLGGVRVLDLSTSIAGGYCTKVLADYGAEVVKIEPPGLDPIRHMGPFPGPDRERHRSDAGGLFQHLHTNKFGLIIDPSNQAGADVIRDLVRTADVVVESSRPGTMDACGLGSQSLLDLRPSLVYLSVTPFGQTGPYRDFDMSEIVAFAMGGPMNSSGNPEREPVKLVGNVIQMQSGSTAATAVLGAYYHALESGRGQHVDVATYETQNGSLDRRRYYLLSYHYSGYVTERAVKVGAGRVAAGGRFEARDGQLITTGHIWPTHVGRMVGVLGDEELAGRFAEQGEAMMEDAHRVNAAIATWAAGRDGRTAMREAQAAGWPVVVVNDPATLLTDEHLTARGFWVTLGQGPDSWPMCGPAWRLDGGGWSLRRLAPSPGEHTDLVLREAGRTPEEICKLREAGVVA